MSSQVLGVKSESNMFTYIKYMDFIIQTVCPLQKKTSVHFPFVAPSRRENQFHIFMATNQPE